MKAADLIGERFGRLVVVVRAPDLSRGNPRWVCKCDCGQETVSQGGALKNGRQQSCGCLQREVATRHGMERSATYQIWAGMKGRCLNSRHRAYSQYGGRGIGVCDAWMDFSAFLADMGPKPDKMTLDRIDNAKGYSPENCRWATYKQQNRNRRSNRVILHDGASKTLAEWAELFGINAATLYNRIKRGWSVEDSLMKPPDTRKASSKKRTK